MKLAEKFTENIAADIKRYSGWIDDANEKLSFVDKLYLIPDELDEFEEDAFWSGIDLYIPIPWNPKTCDELCLFLESAGWYKSHDWKTSSVGDKPKYYIYYHHEEIADMELIIKMESSHEDSTCTLVQVGTETVEKPVWQVQCAEEFSVEDL